MNKKVLSLAITLVFSFGLSAQKLNVLVNYVTRDVSSTNDTIYYQPGKSLSWEDFKGKPVTGTDAVALTSAGFGLKLMFRQYGSASQLVISVSCSFSKKNSWVLPANKTAYILNHEQKHFDITFIHTLLFIQSLRQANFTNSNYAATIENIYNETTATMSKIQDQYDAETSHSRVPEKQAAWDKLISEQLASALKNNKTD